MDDDAWVTKLTYKEALAIDDALKHALEVEKTRLKLDNLLTKDSALHFEGSKLLGKLSQASYIMDVRRERADDMGG